MTLPLLIVLAVAMPFVVLGVLWLIFKEAVWLGKRPRLRGIVYLGIGAAYFPFAIWEVWKTPSIGSVSLLIVCTTWIGLGVHDIRRGRVIEFEETAEK